MEIQATSVFRWNYESKHRVTVNQGGFDNVPIKAHDHIWDAFRYAAMYMIGGHKLPQFG